MPLTFRKKGFAYRGVLHFDYGSVATETYTLSPRGVADAGGWAAGGQCSNTVKGLLCTNLTTKNNYLTYPGGGKFDVIHINYGLHDLVAPCPPGGTGECEEHVALPGYGANLVTLFQRFSTIGTKLIWTTTTPVPNVSSMPYGRTYANVTLYNAQALKSLQGAVSNLLVDDLWGGMIAVCGAGYASCPLQLPKDVHLTSAGINATAQLAFQSIMAALGE